MRAGRHRGRYVESQLNRGTTFTIYFPRVGSASGAESIVAPKPSIAPHGTETLLIVEDEPSVRMLAQGALKAQGYDVLIALNDQDASCVTREHKGPRIALVVADVVMPRMGGKAMAEWLRALDPQLKILFTSGYTEDAVAAAGSSAEGIDFLPKPYTRWPWLTRCARCSTRKQGR